MRLQLQSKGRYRGVFFFILSTLIISTLLLMFFMKRAEPIFKERAADATTQALRALIDDISNQLVSQYDIFDEKKMNNDKLSTIELNTTALNSLRTAFSQELSKSISNTYYTKIYISAGSLFNNVILQGVGFRIPVRIFFGAISHIDIKDEFISAGINQTKYRATLEIAMSSSVVSAFMTDSREINVSLPICERIFIGEVPSYYIRNGEKYE